MNYTLERDEQNKDRVITKSEREKIISIVNNFIDSINLEIIDPLSTPAPKQGKQ